jgi:hypothetical protein
MGTERDRWPSVSLTRICLILVVPIAVVVGVRGWAWATASIVTFQSGETLTANDLNTNFAAINNSMVDLSTTQTITGEKTFATPIDIGLESLTFLVNGTLPAGCASPSSTYVDCQCPAGKTVIAGGGYAGPNLFIDESRDVTGSCATGAGTSCWRVACANSAGTRTKCTYVNIVCARIKR